MREVDVHHAGEQFTEMLRLAEGGERVLITRSGRPVAELHRIELQSADANLSKIEALRRLKQHRFQSRTSLDEVAQWRREGRGE